MMMHRTVDSSNYRQKPNVVADTAVDVVVALALIVLVLAKRNSDSESLMIPPNKIFLKRKD
jgi:hypothetical protein